MKAPALVITCEHASNAVPDFVVRAFKIAGLAGIPKDTLYRRLVRTMRPDFYLAGKFSRLVADLNRSESSRDFFSAYTRDLPDNVKEHIRKLWLQHHNKVEHFVAKHIAGHSKGLHVIHLGIHSFTPILNNVIRNADVGRRAYPRNQGPRTGAAHPP